MDKKRVSLNGGTLFLHKERVIAEMEKQLQAKYYVQVTDIIDGDTFEGNIILPQLDEEKKHRHFRLVGIDTPEKKVIPGKNKWIDKELAFKAQEFAAQQIDGKTIIVEITGKDKYGRYLTKAYLEGEETLNDLLLKEGLARVWV
jgi:endonuclease YncB( thermonuclease family)